MTKEEQLHLARDIATMAHADQTDRSGIPYINHPKTVASLVDGIDEKTVAWLHDVVEDTDITIDDLKEKGFSKEIIDAVAAMTHDSSVDYFDYAKNIKENKLARSVKIADLTHNMDISRIENPTALDYERLEKYKKAMDILQ